jgi:cytochrome P450
MTDQPAALSFPVPYAPPEGQSSRAIAATLRNNALANLPRRVFEEMAVARSFVGRQQIILNDPVVIRHVLIENAENYGRTPSIYRLLGPIVGRGGMLLADGEDWREQRRAAAPAFAPRAMPAIAEHVAREGDRLIADLLASRGAPVDLFADLQLTTLKIAAKALFSIEIGDDEGPRLRSELQGYARGIGRPTMLDFLLPRGFPTPRSWPRWRFGRQWMAHMRQLLAARQAEPPADPPRDLFDMMVASGASGRQLVEQAATILVAGHETTAVALFWTCYILASLPEVQDRLAAEARRVALDPVHGAAAVAALPYARAVVDETLRLYPPAFSITRQAHSDDEANGIRIPRRGVVLMIPWVLHRHAKLWRDPDAFDPGRFLPGSEPPQRFTYLPFGMGVRACIGAQFAVTESVLIVARLMQAFHIELGDDLPVLPMAAVTLQPNRSPPFRLIPRTG